MSYLLQDSYDTVQVLSPTLSVDAIYCTIVSLPSGSVLQRTVPKDEFDRDQGQGILASLSQAVEDLISGGLATGAYGAQEPDDSGLIQDVVVFTVGYVPQGVIAGTITTTVSIPVNILTADTSIIGGSGLESPAQLLRDAYDRLAAMATG